MTTALLEIGRPAEGVFVLNSSALDGSDLLAAGPTEALEWEDITDQATTITARRGGQRDATSTQAEVGILTAEFIDGADPTADPNTYRPGVAIRLGRPGGENTDFTGAIRDLRGRYDKKSKVTRVTLTAADAVDAIANVTRYGATVAEGSEPWPARFRRLIEHCPVPFEEPEDIDVETPVITHDGTDEAGAWSGSWHTSAPALIYDGFDGGPVTRVITGLAAGTSYRLRTVWEPSPSPIVAEIDADTLDTSTSAMADYSHAIDITFVASDTSHTLTVSTGGGYYLILYALELTSIDYVPWAPSIAKETNLADHFDIAATSAGVAWIVDRDGTGRVVQPSGDPVLHFSDAHDPEDPLHVCYTFADVAFDTTAIVNELVVTNNTVGDDGAAVTTSHGPYTDLTSIATYGNRSARVETAIATDGLNGYTDGIDRLAESVLDRLAEPQVTISGVTINATKNPAIADLIELQALVQVTWRTITRELVIIAIEHRHFPKKYEITLTLGDA